MLDALDVQDAITLLLALAVLALTVALVYVTRPDRPDPAAPVVGNEEVTQELPVIEVDPVWRAFYATAPRRRRWLSRRSR
ncbi:hypothetical protein AB0N38_33260 [Micromonospora aurantiaca]|uniref:hypothetical protein n=1 Tax=Micromonospora aurantiaca (nom. illeg.) TaxID=47850 RepID=UPI00343BB2F6